MKKLFNILFLFLLTLIFSSNISSSVSIPTSPKYTFQSQSVVLSNSVFPEIKKYIEETEFTEKKADEFSAHIYQIILSHIKNQELKIINFPQVKVGKLTNKLFVIYLVEVNINLADLEESQGHVITSFVVHKTFLIKIDGLISAEI